ncbi:hypothetical protein DFH29DRAFT_1000029 [Suillus ampliporus]|nr:hypothetical protein DFH29DRAFT_1000029 [Suillus ampliporus]
MCTVRGFNLSFECLVGFQARDRLRNLKNTDPEFWKELTGPNEQDVDVSMDTTKIEDETHQEEPNFDDDSDLPCTAIVADVLGQNAPSGIAVDADGKLTSTVEAEKLMFEVLPAVGVSSIDDEDGEELGHGRRKRKPNTLYAHSFWRHDDNEG